MKRICLIAALVLLGMGIFPSQALSSDASFAKLEAISVPGRWEPIGPSLMEQTLANGQFLAVGRLTTMAVDPRNPDVIYVGSPGADGNEGSGVWKTIDGGVHWTPMTDSLPRAAIDVIALDPTNPDRVYIVIYKEGVYRSDSGGESWTFLHAALPVRTNIGPDGDRTVLLINPLHPNILYLTTDLGVQISVDGGYNWGVSLSAGGATSLVMDPQDANTLYAAVSTPAGALGVYKTENGGAIPTGQPTGDASWHPQTSGVPFGGMPGRNILLAISRPTPAVPATVYALYPRGPIVEGGSLFNGISYELYRTTNGGTSWIRRFRCDPDPNDLDSSYINCNFAVMSADPQNPDYIYIGGVLLFVSSMGGENFVSVPADPNNANILPLAPHVDYWELITSPVDDKVLFVVGDGGIYKSTNHGLENTWAIIGEGITNAEMFNISLSDTWGNRAITGTQDNGTSYYDGGMVWHHILGGDGGAVAIDPANPNVFYGSGDNAGRIGRLEVTATGVIVTDIFDGMAGGGKPDTTLDWCHAYEMTFQLQTIAPNTILDACVRLWRNTTTLPLTSWTPLYTPADLTPPYDERVVRFAVDQGSNTYYIGTDTGKVLAGLNGENWQQVFQQPDFIKVSDIKVDPFHRNTIYVSFAPGVGLFRGCDTLPAPRRIYQLSRTDSSSFAMTSLDVSENFPPALCVNSLAIDPHIPRTLYAATDLGVYRGRANASGGPWIWGDYNNGMPLTDVRELQVSVFTGEIYAATFGRSALKVTTDPVLPVSIDIKPGSSENVIHIGSSGKIPVAILSNITFDAPYEVNKTSLTFGHTGRERSLASCSNIAEDVNADGLPDLVCHFTTSLTRFQVGDTQGFLKGFTTEDAPIAGSDTVRILNP